MKINNVLTMFREAELFKYLTSLSRVNRMTVKICQLLLNYLIDHPWTTVQRLSRTLRQHDNDVKFTDVEQVVEGLLKRQILVRQGYRLMFTARLVSNEMAAVSQEASQDSALSSATAHANAKSGQSEQSSSSSGGISSSEEKWVTDQLNDDSVHSSISDSGLSPLSSYFSSVNATLNDDYLTSSSKASSSNHNDHLINRNDMTHFSASSASNSVKSSDRGSHLDFATTPTSNEDSSTSSSSSFRSSELRTSSSRTSTSSKSASRHQVSSAGQKFQSIASSLFKQISFISLMAHPSKVRQLAKAQFNLVVAARKYEGIRQADSLFKYEFKMNYQKFGKIGNQINNVLMKDVSSHNQ